MLLNSSYKMTQKTGLQDMASKWFSRDFWTNFREISGFNDFMKLLNKYPYGDGKCDTWVDLVNQERDRKEPFPFRKAITADLAPEKRVGFQWHVWLEAEMPNGGRYIADGTAGQIDPNYPQGYYGTFEEASDPLKEIFAKRRYF